MKLAVIHRGKRYDVELSRGCGVIAKIGERKFRVDVKAKTVDGRPLKTSYLPLEILDERARLASQIQRAQKSRVASREIVAPLPGLVTGVLVKAGQKVSRGAPLVTLTAMKLENEIQSPADATVARVHVKPSQPVEKGQTLVSLA